MTNVSTSEIFTCITGTIIFQRSKKELKKDEAIKIHLKTYVKEDLINFLDGLIKIFSDSNKKAASVKKKFKRG